MTATHSALIITVPAAEAATAVHRRRLDTAASWGIPAHVTVLYPFMAPDLLDEQVLHTLGHLVAGHPPFDLQFRDTAWFGDTVLYLAPEPAAPVQALTAAVHARFPQHPPYGGVHDDVVAHLTVGHDRPHAELRAAEADVRRHLPIRQRVTAVDVITGRPEPGRPWDTVARLPLRPA